MCTILIISLIGANVLLNCTTRYNVTAKQVKAWKEALYAAESGGDIGFAEVRKVVSNPSTEPSVDGLTCGFSPTPGPSYSNGPYTLDRQIVFRPASQSTGSNPADPNGNVYYRIRATGTATLLGLREPAWTIASGEQTTRGESLLRKIDFKYDHFKPPTATAMVITQPFKLYQTRKSRGGSN